MKRKLVLLGILCELFGVAAGGDYDWAMLLIFVDNDEYQNEYEGGSCRCLWSDSCDVAGDAADL